MSQYEFIKAALGQPHQKVPIWIMRQAGRYMAEFRELREKVSFMEICHSPELIADVTRQPIDKFGFDAAIMFSDILLPLEPLGFKINYENGINLTPPIRHPDDVARLKKIDPASDMDFVLAGIRETKRRLNDTVPLIGFCGSPFTMACYLVEGGSSWNFTEIKKFIYNHPLAARHLMEQLAEISGRYLALQIQNGVDAVQIFDSWGGILSPQYYQQFSLPYLKTVLALCRSEKIPRIVYLNNARPYLHLLAELDCEVAGIDWRTDLIEAADILDGKTLQGNLDPHLLLGPADTLREETLSILETMADRHGFIFNLGHGINPETPEANVRLLVDTVQSWARPDNSLPAPDSAF